MREELVTELNEFVSGAIGQPILEFLEDTHLDAVKSMAGRCRNAGKTVEGFVTKS